MKIDRQAMAYDAEIEGYIQAVMAELSRSHPDMTEEARVALLRNFCGLMYQSVCRLTGSIRRAEQAETDLLQRLRTA